MNKELIWTGIFTVSCIGVGYIYGKLTSDNRHIQARAIESGRTYKMLIDVLNDKIDKEKTEA